MADQFYGDRSGTLADPFGNVWHIATHIKDLSSAEIETAAVDCMPSAPKKGRSTKKPRKG